MKEYIWPIIVTACFIAVMMSFIKEDLNKLNIEISSSFLRLLAVLICIFAIVLSHWAFNFPHDLKECVVCFFPLYVFQEIIDLDFIKRVVKIFVKGKLRRKGAKEDDLKFLDETK